MSGGTLDLNGNDTTIGSLGGTTGTVNLGAGTLTTGDGSNSDFGGSINGSGGLTKQGSGIFTLSGSNGYIGTTAINNGSLKTTHAGALGDGVLTIASTGTLDITNLDHTVSSLNLNGGTISGTGKLTAATYTLAGGTVGRQPGAGRDQPDIAGIDHAERHGAIRTDGQHQRRHAGTGRERPTGRQLGGDGGGGRHAGDGRASTTRSGTLALNGGTISGSGQADGDDLWSGLAAR